MLETHHLADFEALWSLDAGWFEPPNQRRGGWSGVSRYTLANGEAVFIKRQENHVYRPWNTLFRPVATFAREYDNLLRFRRLGIATMEPLYFGQRSVDGKLRAILVTRELAGYLPADAECYQPISRLSRLSRHHLIIRIAAAVRDLHQQHLQHNCLYAKHIFIRKTDGDGWDVRFIDLEKAKWRPFLRLIAIRDFGSLYRHTLGWSRNEQLRLFLAYRQERRLSAESKKILRAIFQQTKAKRRLYS